MKSITEQALRYVSLGLSVIPIGDITLTSTGGKHIEYPVSWTAYQSIKPTEEVINFWFEERGFKNIGIVTGKVSRLFVLDTDSYKPGFDHELLKSWNLPITPVQQTARGGRQYFFQYDGDATNAVNVFAKDSGIDIRANGGMVIAPPTKTSYGEYTWIVSPEDTPFAPLPKALEDLFANQVKPEHKSSKALPTLMGLVEGEGRDNAMTVFAGKLIASTPKYKWQSEVWPAMVQVNATYKPPLSQADLERIYKSITTKDSKKKENPAAKEVSVRFGQLMATEFPPARFAVDPFFELNTVNMVSAPPNTWKSWLLFIMAAAIAEGSKALNRFATIRSKVMIINEEDSSRAIQDRFKLLGITDPELDIWFRVAQGAKLEDDFVATVIAECKEHDITTVMFDSLRSVHDADENDSTTMQAVMDQLKKISRENITVIFTHHHRKKNMFQKGDNAEASRGSSAINAAISGHISLDEEVRESGTFVVVRHLKSKAGAKIEPFELKVDVTATSVKFIYDGEHESGEKKVERAKGDALMFLTGNEGWHGSKDFTGVDVGGKGVLKAALKVLVSEGKVECKSRKQLISENASLKNDGSVNELLFKLSKKGKADMEGTVEQVDMDFADFNIRKNEAF